MRIIKYANSLRDISIGKKITLYFFGICTLAITLTCVSFYTLLIKQHQVAYGNEINSLAKIIAGNCRVSLAFVVPEDTDKVLATLREYPAITTAKVYDSNGMLFAGYGNNKFTPTLPPGFHQGPDTCLPGDKNHLTVRQEIIQDGVVIGSIWLVDDLRGIHAFKKIALLGLLLIIVLVMVLSFFLAAKLSEFITRPIRELESLAAQITLTQDYSERAVIHGQDEVGKLGGALNKMLCQMGTKTADLQKSEQRFRHLINQAVDSFFLHDLEGRIIDVNERACNSLGYCKEELLQLSLAGEIDTRFTCEQYKDQFWHNLYPESTITLETVFRRKDGMSFPVEARLGLLEFDNDQFIMVLSRDITDRQEAAKEKEELEEHLQQAQKMEAIGTLAGGIAHDFNNILSAILGYTELARMKAEPETAIYSDLEQVLKASERARQLVSQILTFSRQKSKERIPLQVYLVVKEAVKLLHASIPSTIEIRQEITSKAAVLGDPTQIHQLVMNLCTNAYHAMQETGGVLAVGLRDIDIDRNGINGVDLPPGSYVKLEVTDNGSGMDKETCEKIFEPYFTTKAQGKGTGLGLAVVHGVVKSHQGRVSVDSELGHGTTFCIYLPTIGGKTNSNIQEITNVDLKGHEHIMVVDDEETIRNLAQDFLTSTGYQVDIFENGQKAWEFFANKPAAWDLIITDQTMPQMTGIKLAEKALALRPDLPIILCTGYSENINSAEAKEMGVSAYLHKPIVRGDLLACVRKVLDAKIKNEEK